MKMKTAFFHFFLGFAVFFASEVFAKKSSHKIDSSTISSDATTSLIKKDPEKSSSSDVTQEFEKVLLRDSVVKNDVFNDGDNNYNDRSDLYLKAGKNNDPASKPVIDMVINESHVIVNSDVRTKEKMAYNAAISNQNEAAIELYKQVISAEPDNYYAMFSLATIYQKLNQFHQAKVLYYKLLTSNPENKQEVMGNILSLLIEESPKDAVYVLSRLSAQNPHSAYILSRGALAYANVENYSRAIALQKQALALDPTRVDYQYNLAIIYDQAKEYEHALGAYRNVVKSYNSQDPSASTISLQQVQNRIESIKNKV